MALSVVKLFAATQLGTSAATLFTCPASPSTSVLKNGRMRFANTTAAAVSVTAYIVPNAGTPSASNEFVSNLSVAANAYVDVDIPSMASGDMLQALASAATSITVQEMGGVLFS